MADNKEKFCSNCKHDSKLATEAPCNECCNAYTSKFEAKTNFDRIKEMSVDELASFIRFDAKWMSDIDVKKWLESEVESNV